MATNDIPVTIDSSSLKSDMTVLVFGINYTFVTQNDINVAWKTFPSGMSSKFIYPKATTVGGFYYTDNGSVKNTVSGPVAAPGTTWDYVTSSQDQGGQFVQDSK